MVRVQDPATGEIREFESVLESEQVFKAEGKILSSGFAVTPGGVSTPPSASPVDIGFGVGPVPPAPVQSPTPGVPGVPISIPEPPHDTGPVFTVFTPPTGPSPEVPTIEYPEPQLPLKPQKPHPLKPTDNVDIPVESPVAPSPPLPEQYEFTVIDLDPTLSREQIEAALRNSGIPDNVKINIISAEKDPNKYINLLSTPVYQNEDGGYRFMEVPYGKDPHTLVLMPGVTSDVSKYVGGGAYGSYAGDQLSNRGIVFHFGTDNQKDLGIRILHEGLHLFDKPADDLFTTQKDAFSSWLNQTLPQYSDYFTNRDRYASDRTAEQNVSAAFHSWMWQDGSSGLGASAHLTFDPYNGTPIMLPYSWKYGGRPHNRPANKKRNVDTLLARRFGNCGIATAGEMANGTPQIRHNRAGVSDRALQDLDSAGKPAFIVPKKTKVSQRFVSNVNAAGEFSFLSPPKAKVSNNVANEMLRASGVSFFKPYRAAVNYLDVGLNPPGPKKKTKKQKGRKSLYKFWGI